MPAITVDNDESDYSECLYPGAKFKGEQKSKTQRYQVDVQIDYVNWEQSYICGVLNIIGLTDHDPQIKTFFNGEIIGPDFSFLTRKWEADYKRDLEHWRYVCILNGIIHIFNFSKFKQFEKYKHIFNNDDFDHSCLLDSPVVFMRWKEQFTLPNHRGKFNFD